MAKEQQVDGQSPHSHAVERAETCSPAFDDGLSIGMYFNTPPHRLTDEDEGRRGVGNFGRSVGRSSSLETPLRSAIDFPTPTGTRS